MTKSKVDFDPFSDEFFNGAWDTYRRMQEEAPVFYSEQYDFYALTRHEDVAAGLKNFETYSSAYGIDLSMVRSGEKPPQSIIFMDPPDHRHMRSLMNKVFTPRAIQSQREMVVEKVEKYLNAVDPDGFDVVQEFSAPFPVEVITHMLGVPDEHAQQVRHWIDESLTREPGQVEVGESGMQANINTAMLYYELVMQRREDPRDDLFTRLIEAEIETALAAVSW